MGNFGLRAGFVLETTAAAETEALGAAAGACLPPGLTLALRGELGAGKTVFVRGLARGWLGTPAEAVTSPTYVLQHVYRGERGAIYHIDAYRMRGGGAEFEASGLGECLADGAGVVCLEWPERAEDVLPVDRLDLEFEHVAESTRAIHIHATGPRSAEVVQALIARAGSLEKLRARMQAPPTN